MRLFIILLLSLAARVAFAQANDSTASAHFIIGATANSGLNYYGRVDSLHSKALYPFIGVALKNGLYCNANFVFIQNSLQSQYAATIVEGGYNFKDSKGHWAGNVSVSRFFYQQDINLIQSAIKQTASASITRLNKIVDLTLGANVKWSDKTDFGVQAGLDHIFRFPHIFGDDDVIVLDPGVNVYAGTRNYTQTYYEKRDLLIFPIAEQQVTTTSQQFVVLAYEWSIPLVYGYKKFNFILTPAYILPQNLLVVPGQPSLSENGANLFYVTASVKFTL
ncbi:MAG TPA: hypothetical protein VKQ52_16380 [Puia sp.]|nr:hypothetical protein [Puia sp.]